MGTDTLVFYAYLFRRSLLFLDANVDEEREEFPNSKGLASGCCLEFA